MSGSAALYTIGCSVEQLLEERVDQLLGPSDREGGRDSAELDCVLSVDVMGNLSGLLDRDPRSTRFPPTCTCCELSPAVWSCLSRRLISVRPSRCHFAACRPHTYRDRIGTAWTGCRRAGSGVAGHRRTRARRIRLKGTLGPRRGRRGLDIRGHARRRSAVAPAGHKPSSQLRQRRRRSRALCRRQSNGPAGCARAKTTRVSAAMELPSQGRCRPVAPVEPRPLEGSTEEVVRRSNRRREAPDPSFPATPPRPVVGLASPMRAFAPRAHARAVAVAPRFLAPPRARPPRSALPHDGGGPGE